MGDRNGGLQKFQLTTVLKVTDPCITRSEIRRFVRDWLVDTKIAITLIGKKKKKTNQEINLGESKDFADVLWKSHVENIYLKFGNNLERQMGWAGGVGENK